MAEIIEFELEHDLDYDDAVEVVYEMLDEYYENDDFDDLEWDEDEEMAYLANEAMEVEIYVDDGFLEVHAEIYDRDMSPRQVERDLRNDLMEFFEVEERPRRRRSGAPRSKSSGRDRRSEHNEESSRSSRSSRKSRKKSGGNWDMEEETSKESAPKKEVVKKEEEKVEESGGSSMGWIFLIVAIIAAIVGFVFFKT